MNNNVNFFGKWSYSPYEEVPIEDLENSPVKQQHAFPVHEPTHPQIKPHRTGIMHAMSTLPIADFTNSGVSHSAYAVTVDANQPGFEEELFAMLEKHPNLTNLTLSGRLVTTQIVRRIASTCDSLASLTLKSCSPLKDDVLSALPQSLRTLEIHDCPKITFEEIAVHIPLEKLVIDNCLISDEGMQAIGHLVSLQTLAIKNCLETDPYAYFQLASLTAVRSLNFSNSMISGEACRFVLGALKSLQSLCLSGCKEISDDNFEFMQIPKNCKSVDLSDTTISDEGLRQVLKTSHSLEELDVSHCDAITHEGFYRAHFPQSLKLFTARGVKITDEGIVNLLERSVNLQHVQIVSHYEITNDVLFNDANHATLTKIRNHYFPSQNKAPEVRVEVEVYEEPESTQFHLEW